jgi:hypothetical protein
MLSHPPPEHRVNMAGPDALLIRDRRPPELGEKSVKLVSICQSDVIGVHFKKGEISGRWKSICQLGANYRGSVKHPAYFDEWSAEWRENKKQRRKAFFVRNHLREGQSIYDASHRAEAFHECRRAAEGERS